jgi:hypothetical protein
MKRNDVFYIKWGSTIVLLFGVWLTSINYYPLNVFVSFAGNLGWLFVGLAWGEYSLITVQAVILLIYASGLITHS